MASLTPALSPQRGRNVRRFRAWRAQRFYPRCWVLPGIHWLRLPAALRDYKAGNYTNALTEYERLAK